MCHIEFLKKNSKITLLLGACFQKKGPKNTHYTCVVVIIWTLKKIRDQKYLMITLKLIMIIRSETKK